MSSPIAVIGLGSMGAALANRLLDCEKDIHIWNRTTTRPTVQALIARGAKISASAAEAIKPSAVVVFCVLDYKTSETILSGVDAVALKGKKVVNLTNGTISEARQMSEKMYGQYGVAAYVDGAIMATPKMVGTEDSFVFCSGASKDGLDDEARSLLELFGHVDYLGSDPGSAATHDLALLAAMYGMFDGTLTGVGLLFKLLSTTSNGQKPGTVTEIVSTKLVPMLQALLPSLVSIVEDVETGNDSAGDYANSMMLQGLRNIVDACAEAGVDAGGTKHLMAVFEEVEAEGGGSGGFGLVGRKYFKSETDEKE